MLRKTFTTLCCLTFASLAIMSSGCVQTSAVSLGPLAIPIPVTAYMHKLPEDRWHIQERYKTVPILGPIAAGGPTTALDPPSDDEVMRAFEKARPIQGGVPFLRETQRINVRIVKEKIADYIDPPRHYPLLGPAQLHHAHYKCTIYYSEIRWIGWPIPHMLEDEDGAEVLYIDHNHFHMVGNVDPGVGTNY